MSHIEKGSQPSKPDFKLFVPSLIPPYEGAFEEIYVEYLTDPIIFMNALRYRMAQENPALTIVIDTPVVAGDLEASRKWAAVYYELFARSATRLGLPPMLVPMDKAHRYVHLGIAKSSGVTDEETRTRFIEGSRVKSAERRARDEALSPELVKFWNMVDQYERIQAEEGVSEYEVFGSLQRLSSMQALLQYQEDEFALIGQDINGLL